MAINSREEELVALEFESLNGLAHCLELLEKERPDTFFDLPGRQSVILPRQEFDWFKKKISEMNHRFSEVSVVSANTLPSRRVAQLRAQLGKPSAKRYGDLDWKKARIEELRKKLGPQ